jgi:hypothetical protein
LLGGYAKVGVPHVVDFGRGIKALVSISRLWSGFWERVELVELAEFVVIDKWELQVGIEVVIDQG